MRMAFSTALKVLRLTAATLVLFSATIGSASAQQLLRDTEIEQWIDDYSLPIFRAAGLPAEQVNILLIGDPTPNAFAGGLNMGIHTGLITTADTPNQVVGVIAHEAGHIAGGHTARSDEALANATRPMLLSLVLAAGAIAAGAPDAGLAVLGLGQTIGVANALKYSRGQESSADQAAITYLDRVGHSSRGLIEFFGKLRNLQVITARQANPYLQTHPLANNRMSALTRRAQESEHYLKTDTPEEIKRMRMIQAKIKGFLQEAHFTMREYPLSDSSDPARYARAVAYYRSAQIEKGLEEIDTLIAKDPDNPYFFELKGQMLFEYGRVQESIEPHRRSTELAPTKALLKINLGRALLATEDTDNYDAAIKVFKSALQLEPDNSFGWYELARAHGGLDQIGLAHLASAESRYHVGDKGQANQFARRALAALDRGTPEYRKAADIIVATQGDLPKSAQNNDERQGPSPEEEKRRPGDVPDPLFK
ncbi:MAG: M48 family metalloprotease [Pseudomonadota bacterium]